MKLKLFAISVLMSVIASTSAFADSDINVSLNGSMIEFTDQKPIIQDGRTLVPLRGVFDAMGYEIKWLEDSKTAALVKNGVSIIIKIGSNEIKANGNSVSIDVPAQIINSRTMIPLRAVAEISNATVDWNNDKRLVSVVYDESEPIYADETYNKMETTEKEYMQALISGIKELKEYAGGMNDLILSRVFNVGDLNIQQTNAVSGEQYSELLKIAKKIENLQPPKEMSDIHECVSDYLMLLEDVINFSRQDNPNNLFSGLTKPVQGRIASYSERLNEINMNFGNSLMKYFMENEIYFEGIYGEYILDLLIQQI